MFLKDDGNYEGFNWIHSSMYFSSTAELMATRFRDTPDEDFVFPNRKDSNSNEKKLKQNGKSEETEDVIKSANNDTSTRVKCVNVVEHNDDEPQNLQPILCMMRDIMCKVPLPTSISNHILNEVDSHMGNDCLVKLKEMVDEYDKVAKTFDEKKQERKPNIRPQFDKPFRGNRKQKFNRRNSDFGGNQYRSSPNNSGGFTNRGGYNGNYNNSGDFSNRGCYNFRGNHGNNYHNSRDYANTANGAPYAAQNNYQQ